MSFLFVMVFFVFDSNLKDDASVKLLIRNMCMATVWRHRQCRQTLNIENCGNKLALRGVSVVRCVCMFVMTRGLYKCVEDFWKMY